MLKVVQHIIIVQEQLTETRSPCTESMLAWVEEIVCFKMFDNVVSEYFFEHLDEM